MNCKICGSTSSYFGDGRILNKYSVRYFRCENCGFIQTEEPYWLDEVYSEAITKSDIGLLGRNLQTAAQTQKLLLTCFDPKGKFIDYGAGYGIFVRLMRDRGFDFYYYDPLQTNLFAKGFEAKVNTSYSLLTAWEVFEHFQDPLNEIEKILSFSRNLLFSTILLPRPPRPLNEWWYYGLEHGQHVSFYTLESLRIVAQKFNLKLHYSNGSHHFIGDPLINSFRVKIAFIHRYRWIYRMIAKPAPPSMLASDYYTVTGNYLN